MINESVLFLARAGDSDTGSAVAIVAIIFGTIYLIIRTIVCGVRRKKSGDLNDMDLRKMEELHHRIGQMSARVEALETILMDRTMPSDRTYVSPMDGESERSRSHD